MKILINLNYKYKTKRFYKNNYMNLKIRLVKWQKITKNKYKFLIVKNLKKLHNYRMTYSLNKYQ